MYNPMSLDGKKILITGASSGIGREVALACNKLGASIIAIARRQDLLEQLLTELEGENYTYQFDLSDVAEIETFVDTIIKQHGKVDGLVYSAGITSTRPFSMLKPAKLDEVMNINFNAFVEITRCLTKKKYGNEGLSIVGISSISSIVGNQSKAAYCASKAAMDAVVRCIAKEYSGRGIRANTVAPGLAATKLYNTFMDNSGSESQDAQDIIGRQYLGVVDPTNIANLVAFLISDASNYITGSTIAIDGGRLSS